MSSAFLQRLLLSVARLLKICEEISPAVHLKDRSISFLVIVRKIAHYMNPLKTLHSRKLQFTKVQGLLPQLRVKGSTERI